MTQHAGEGEPFGASRSGEEDAGLSESPRHECGVFGVFGNPEATTLTYLGLYALQHRGQEGAGIVSCDGDFDHIPGLRRKDPEDLHRHR